MGDAGGYAGEFYTPRSLVKAIVSVMDAQPGQTIYDGAAGSCGFLVENFEHFKKTEKRTDHSPVEHHPDENVLTESRKPHWPMSWA